MNGPRSRQTPIVENPTRPLSIGGLAQLLGIPRQRVYDLVKAGKVKAEAFGGGTLVIQPKEAARVIEAATIVDTAKGSRLVFDFI